MLILDFQPGSCASVCWEQTLAPALWFCHKEVVQCRLCLCLPAYICIPTGGVLTGRRLLNMFNKLPDKTANKSRKMRHFGQGQTPQGRRFTIRPWEIWSFFLREQQQNKCALRNKFLLKSRFVCSWKYVKIIIKHG